MDIHVWGILPVKTERKCTPYMAEYGQMPMDTEGMPFSLEAEQSVLGAVLVEPPCLVRIMEIIRAECFYREQHRQIFSVMVRMFTAGTPLDFITILNQVREENIFDSEQDAKVYLAQLVQLVPPSMNIEEYAKIVQEKYYLRSLIQAAQEIIDNTRSGEGDARTILDAAEQSIYEIRQGRDSQGLKRIDEIIIDTYDRLQKLSGEDREKYLGLSSGFFELDRQISGLNKSDLILVAARPGMGKTSFALNIAAYVAKNSDKKVALFSLEMSDEQIASKLLSTEASIVGTSLKTGQLDGDDWVRLAQSAQILSKSNIYIDDTSGITVSEMKAKLRRVKDLGLVIIDYLQLMTSGRRNENRVQEVSEITRSLKIMAKELNVPVITLAQLSRGPEARADHRPMLSDLRESGSIEQDADIVMMLFREAYYDKSSENPNIAECIVAKNRHGETGTVKLSWEGQFTRFGNLELFRNEE